MSVIFGVQSHRVRWSRWGRAVFWLLCCPAAMLWVARSRADEVTSKYFDQLRRRRLFSVAEGYCLAQLSRERLPPGKQADLTLELSRTFAEHAKFTAGDEQADLWKRAAQVLDEFLQQSPQHPRRPLLEVQAAFVPAAQGEFMRWQAELFPFNKKLRQQAQIALELAVPKLKALSKSLDEQLHRKRKKNEGSEARLFQKSRDSHRERELSPRELRTLWYNVRYRLAAALMDQAKLLPAGSADRTSNLLDAQDLLRRLAGGVPGEVMTFNSQVLLAECSRLRGDLQGLKQAVDMLTEIAKSKPPRQVLDRVMAERVRVLLAIEKPADAAQMLVDYRKLAGSLTGELRFLNVTVLIALWEIAGEKDDRELAAGLFQQIESRVDRAGREIGGYWGHRCRLLLERARESRLYGSELAQLVRKARAAYADGQVDDAIGQYAQAAATAHRNMKPELAMELGYTRASIQLQAKRYESAAGSFHELAERFPADKRAANAHLLWAYCLGKLHDQQRTVKSRLDYSNALTLHREKFAGEATAGEATWMLARLEERQLQVTRALKLYQQVPAAHRRGPDAQVAVARCYERILERLRESQQPAADWEREAIDWLAQRVAKFPAEPDPLSLQQAEIVLRLARILLNRQPADSLQADRLLRRILSSWQRTRTREETPPKAVATAWKPLLKTAAQLRIIALAGQPGEGPRQAALLVQELSFGDTAEVLNVLDGLMQLAKGADASTRRAVSELQLQAAAGLDRRRSEMNAAEQRRLDWCLAQAYLSTGQPTQAIEVCESLMAKSPRDKRLLRTVSESLVECGTNACLRKAKSTWRRLESLEKAGSVEWLEARYHVVWCSFALKQYNACRKLLGVTRLLYPDLGGKPLRTKFAKLQQQLTEQ